MINKNRILSKLFFDEDELTLVVEVDWLVWVVVKVADVVLVEMHLFVPMGITL